MCNNKLAEVKSLQQAYYFKEVCHTMRAVYVPLDEASLRRLVELAEREKRRPQDQAAWLLEQALQGLDVVGDPPLSKREALRCSA